MNVDIEIYLKQFISFFENNEEELILLIGDLKKKEIFYSMVKQQSQKNYKNGEDVILTQQQIKDILYNLRKDEVKKSNSNNLIEKMFIQETKFGKFFLN